MAAKIFRINYKSDFILTMNSEAGWVIPFCIKFWTSIPSRAYYVGYDGETYTHCAYDPSEPTKLVVQFDDHHLPIGDLKFQIAYHFTVADFPNNIEDEVFNETALTTEIDGETYQVMLDFNGETAPGIDFSLPSVGVTSVNGKIGVVTLSAEDVGAQPTIEDLATIRSGAAAGATAVQPAALQEGLAGKQDTISDLSTIRSGAAAGATAVQPAGLTPIESALQTIEAVIPSAASLQNQLADKNFVNNSIATNTANFVGTYNSLAELQAVQNPTNNDYGFVIETDAQGNEYYDRYKYVASSQQWLFEYKVESTPFTAAQWAAIQSGITSALVTKLNALPTNAELQQTLDGKADAADIPTALSQLSQDSTHRVVTDAEKSTWNGKQDTISDLSTIRSGAAAGATAVQPAAMNTALAAKQDMLTFDNAPTANSDNPVKSSGIKIALDAKQSTINTVNVTVDNNTGTPSGSASVSGSTLSLSFQNLKGATGATGATGPQGPQGERGLPGESGVTGDVSGFTVIQTIDPSATYGATDIAGAATVQATNQELTELAGEVFEETQHDFVDVSNQFVSNNMGWVRKDTHVVASSSMQRVWIFNVNPGEIYRVTCYPKGGLAAGVSYWLGSTYVSLEDSFVGDEFGNVRTGDVTIPSGVDKMYVCGLDSEGITVLRKEIVYTSKFNTLQTQIDGLGQQVSDVSNEIDDCKEALAKIQEIEIDDNSLSWVDGYWKKNGAGAATGTLTQRCTIQSSVAPAIRIVGSSSAGSALSMIAKWKGNVFVEDVVVGTVSEAFSYDETLVFDDTFDNIRVSRYKSYASTFHAYKYVPNGLVDCSDLELQVSKLENRDLLDYSLRCLTGKVIIILGDSSTTTNKWPALFINNASKYNYQVICHAYGSSSWIPTGETTGGNNDPSKSVWVQWQEIVNNIPQDCDDPIIIITSGANGRDSLQMGYDACLEACWDYSENDNMTTELDGAIITLKKITMAYPKCRLYLGGYFPTGVVSGSYAMYHKQILLNEFTLAMCDFFGATYLNLFEECQIRTWLENYNVGGQYPYRWATSDGVHVTNEEGYTRLFNYILSKITLQLVG